MDGDCIRRNVYMYLCGASVDCRSMMNFATSAVEQITSVLADIMPAVYKDTGVHRFYIPLTQGLELLHSQGNRTNMFHMRVAMAKLVDVTLLYLMVNEGFKDTFKPHWGREIYPMCFWDSVVFRRMGLIGEADEDAVVAVESDEGTVVGEGEKGELEEEDDVTPRPEERQRDAAVTWGLPAQRGVEQQRYREDTDPQVETPSRAEPQTNKGDAEPQPDVWCLSISKY
ncbi:hypothetical protein BR93DRAFT_929305 [Coniochaeta sp. PMI_546]|nr:hypothetical protein BR93DRAFT_929305 [Coniochaeta sp. PMI_546]